MIDLDQDAIKQIMDTMTIADIDNELETLRRQAEGDGLANISRDEAKQAAKRIALLIVARIKLTGGADG